MRTTLLMAAPVAAMLLLAASAKAETPEELAYGLGQFAGAASACEIPDDRIESLMERLLRNVGVDPDDDDSPPMQRFGAGLAAGVDAMKLPNAAPCTDVRAAFENAAQQAR